MLAQWLRSDRFDWLAKTKFWLVVTWAKNFLRLTGGVFLSLILTEPPSKLLKWHYQKKRSFKIAIRDFHEQNTVFHLSSIHCRHRHRCYNYRRRSTTKIKVFTSMRNSHRTWLWTRCWKANADLWFLMNRITRSISTLQFANIGIDILSASFKVSNDCKFFNFLKGC